jgi:hypothetical protein
MMMTINDIPVLKGDNYYEWYKKLDLFFIMTEMDWVLTAPVAKEPVAPVQETTETDAAWQQRELAYQQSKRKYDSDHTK